MPGQEALSLLFGLLAAVCANIGMAVQKQGTAGLLCWRHFFVSAEVRRRMGLWVVGTGVRVLGVVLVFPALQWGHAAIIASFSGIGLASLVLYSGYVMEEPVTRNELLGASMIGFGTCLLGYWGSGAGPESAAGATAPLLAFTAVVATATLAIAWSARGNHPPVLALVIAGCAGAMDGLSLLFLKFAGAQALSAGLANVVADLATWGWVLTSIVSFVALQYAYVYGRAVTVVPVFTCVGIAVPMCAAPLIFNAVPTFPVLCGLCLLFIGIVVLTSSAGTVLELELTRSAPPCRRLVSGYAPDVDDSVDAFPSRAHAAASAVGVRAGLHFVAARAPKATCSRTGS